MLIIGQIYVWLPGNSVCDVSSSDWSIVVSKASWHCIVLLGQLAQCLHFTLCCPLSWMLSGFFIHFHFGGAKEQVDLAFWIFICPFATQKCQCFAT